MAKEREAGPGSHKLGWSPHGPGWFFQWQVLKTGLASLQHIAWTPHGYLIDTSGLVLVTGVGLEDDKRVFPRLFT